MEMEFSVGSGVEFGFDVGGGSAPEPTPEPGGVVRGVMLPVMAGMILQPREIVSGTAEMEGA